MNIEYSNATCKKYFSLTVYSDKFILKTVLCFRTLGLLVAFVHMYYIAVITVTTFTYQTLIWVRVLLPNSELFS